MILHNKQKLLVVCGPTATGKTKLAFELAKKFNGEIISADSRMVYRHMDIGTGKDVQKYGKVLGYDLVWPNEQFSVSQYAKFANDAVKNIIEQKKLPILVGGSGLYIKSITDPIETVDIPQNKTLRANLETKTTAQLVEILDSTDPKKLKSMNESDVHNPRRLIRAIEVAGDSHQTTQRFLDNFDVLFVALTADKEILQKRISDRVDERIKNGFAFEVKFLKENNFWNGAPSVTLGYKDWPDIDKWKLEEFKYAKRQMTWFKKEKRITWFDVTKPNFVEDVEKLTQKWYSDSKYASQD